MNLPKRVARRMEEVGRREGVVVVVWRKGRPSRVFRYATYARMKTVPTISQPWKHRKRIASPDPLGAIEGKVLGPIRREDMYVE